MTDIPYITSPSVGLYLHLFVEWDIDKERYVSSFRMEVRKSKEDEINDIILLGASVEELDFLHCIEEDPRAKKLLKKAVNIWKCKLT